MNKTVLCLTLSALASAQDSVVTYHNDNARTGQYLLETLLTPANVKAGSFGKRWQLPRGWKCLRAAVVSTASKYRRQRLARCSVCGDVTHDSVYAFDADDESAAGAAPLWQVNFLDAAAGVTTVSAADVSCPVIPELGISGTPVIDPNAGTIYAIAETKEAGTNYVFRLHALDITTGAERSGSPVVIQPSGFVSQLHKQRTALLLSNGLVYSSWSGHCDSGAFHGWLLAHDPTTLELWWARSIRRQRTGERRFGMEDRARQPIPPGMFF